MACAFTTRKWFVFWFLLGMIATGGALFTGIAEAENVRAKNKTVQKNDKIDYDDSDESEADRIISVGDGKVKITSKIFTPEPYQFKLFPGTATHIDIFLDPSGVAPLRDIDTATQVQFSGTFTAANAGEFPLEGEGNLLTSGSGPGQPPHWSAKVAIAGGVDIDIDSDNNNGPQVEGGDDETAPTPTGFEAPERSAEEDALEDSLPGKLVPLNSGDVDDDDVQNYADGFDIPSLGSKGNNAGANASYFFVPVVIEIPETVLKDGADEVEVKLTYTDSDPLKVTTQPDSSVDGVAYVPAPGYWRLWTIDGDKSRNGKPLKEGGHFVPAATYTAAELGFSSSSNKVTVYLESVRNTTQAGAADHIIKVVITKGDSGDAGDENGTDTPGTTGDTSSTSDGTAEHQSEDEIAVSGVEIVIPEPKILSMEYKDFRPVDITGLKYTRQWTYKTWWDKEYAGSRIDSRRAEPQAYVLKPTAAAKGAFQRLPKVSEDVYRIDATTENIRVLGGMFDDKIGFLAEEGDEKQEHDYTVADTRLAYGIHLPVFHGFVEPPSPSEDPELSGIVLLKNRDLNIRPQYDLSNTGTPQKFTKPPYGSPSFLGMSVRFHIGDEGDADLTDGGRWAYRIVEEEGTPDALPIRASGQNVLGSKFFTVSGNRYGTTVYRIDAKIDGEDPRDNPVVQSAVENLPVMLSEPDPASLHVATANNRRRKDAIDSDNPDFEQADTPLPGDPAYDGRTWSGQTESARTQDQLWRYSMYMLSQIVRKEPGAPGDDELQMLGYPAATTNTKQFSRSQIVSILTTRTQAQSLEDIFMDYAGGPPQQAFVRTKLVSTLDEVLEGNHQEVALAGRRYTEIGVLTAMKWAFSMTKDETHLPTGVWNKSGHHGGNAQIRDYGFWESVLRYNSPLESLFENVEAWRIGHPFTEDIIRHMLVERYALAIGLLEFIDKNAPPDEDLFLASAKQPFQLKRGRKMSTGFNVQTLNQALGKLHNFRPYPAINRNPDSPSYRYVTTAGFLGGQMQAVDDTLEQGNPGAKFGPITFENNWPGTQIDGRLVQLDPDGYFARPAETRDAVTRRGTAPSAIPDVKFVVQLWWDLKYDGGTDAEMNKAGRLFKLTLEEIELLFAMLDDLKTAAWWEEFREEDFFSYVAFVAGDFIFDIQGFYALATGRDLITQEQLTLGERLFTGGVAIVTVVPWGKTIRGGKILLGSASKTMGILSGAAAKSIPKLSTVPAHLATAVSRMQQRAADITAAASQAVLKRRAAVGQIAHGGAATLKQTLRVVTIDSLIANVKDILPLQYGRSIISWSTPAVKGTLGPNRLGKGARVLTSGFKPQKLSRAIKELPQKIKDNYTEAVNKFFGESAEASMRVFKETALAGLDGTARKNMLRTLELAERALCFPADTPVLMADGTFKAIQNVKAGDKVVTRDQSTFAGHLAVRRVTETFSRKVDSIQVMRFRRAGNGRAAHRQAAQRQGSDSDDDGGDPGSDDEYELRATAEHPFYVVGKGWLGASSIAPGDRIIGLEGDAVCVASRTTRVAGGIVVFNFNVDGAHTYFVALDRATRLIVWTHNICEAGRQFVTDMIARPDLTFARTADDLKDLIRIFRVKKAATWGEIGQAFVVGKSQKLARALRAVPGAAYAKGLYQAHHVIPKQTAMTFQVLLNGGTLGGRKWPGLGFLVDDATNGIMLPKGDLLSQQLKLTKHSGAHPGFTKFVMKRMQEINDHIVKKLQAGDKIDEVLRDGIERVKRLQDNIKNAARNGPNGMILPLNKEPGTDEIADLWLDAVPPVVP